MRFATIPLFAATWFLATTQSAFPADSPRGYRPEVPVTAPTRLDWVFALANQSPAEPPAEWVQGYDSTAQKFALFVPDKRLKKGESFPVLLFISAGGGPAGWNDCKAVCEERGMIFASPFGAGNECPMPQRVHIVLDVLDEIRRTYPTDPDRTYIAGFSGGGRVACSIAFALPELFGGAIGVCASGDLREETWLRHRVIDRLNVAFVTGETDFNRGELERFRGPLLDGLGVPMKVVVQPGMGHAIPGGPVWQDIFTWLDSGAARRRKLAVASPTSRLAGDAAPPSREDAARLVFAEGKKRLADRKTLYSGLMLLQGASVRWADTTAGAEAKALLLEYESKDDHPWEEDDIVEQRRSLLARARALDAYATGDLPPQYDAMRQDMLQAALNLWQLVVQDGQDKAAVRDAKKRIPELEKRLEAKE